MLPLSRCRRATLANPSRRRTLVFCAATSTFIPSMDRTSIRKDYNASSKRAASMETAGVVLVLLLLPAGAAAVAPPLLQASSSSSVTSSQTVAMSLTVHANRTVSYGTLPVLISGAVSPYLPAGDNLWIVADGPLGLVAESYVPLNGTGEYSFTLMPQGLACGWVAGAYLVTAYLSVSQGASTVVVTNSTVFAYSPVHSEPGGSTTTSSTATTTTSEASCASVIWGPVVTTTTTTVTMPSVSTTTTTVSTTLTGTRTVTGPGTTVMSTETVTSTVTGTVQTVPTWAYAAMVLLLLVGLGVGYTVQRSPARSDAP